MKRICVFCGSRLGSESVYSERARELGLALVERDIELVFGAGSIGLMGLIADTVLDAGGRVIGVIPTKLAKSEVMHEGLTELRIVPDMHERKAIMSELSDALIAMPGGFGTFEELLEVITWAQLGIQSKPIGILNVAGYYDPLIEMIERGVEKGFIRPQYRKLFVLSATVPDLLEKLDRYEIVPPILKDMGIEDS